MGEIEFPVYIRKVEVARRVSEEEQKIKVASAFSLAYLSWYHGMSKGQKFGDHLKRLGLRQEKENTREDWEKMSKEEQEAYTQKSIDKGKSIIDLLARKKEKEEKEVRD